MQLYNNKNDRNRIMLFDVMSITKQYCDIIEEGVHEVYNRDVNLYDGDKLITYSTLFCCKVDDLDKVNNDIDSFNGKKIEEFKINNEYCHIATYKKDDNDFFVSFDSNDECGIHANYNDKYKVINDFFNKYINFRNDLIDKKLIVKDDDLYQYFSSCVIGFEKNNTSKLFDKILSKIKK